MTHLRRDERGYVNQPKTPGGATNFGTTQAVYDSYRKPLGHRVRSVKLIAEPEVATIYKTQYADMVRYDDLPAGVDHAIFDAAVNRASPVERRGSKHPSVRLSPSDYLTMESSISGRVEPVG
ncbi:lysozyme family protein [Shinella sp. BE166]|uniref:glycosyl hydrolase 108 family protein n=1 Tax=Shinella sp. BE166 TaxID=3373918 RepID=UPI003EBE37E6